MPSTSPSCGDAERGQWIAPHRILDAMQSLARLVLGPMELMFAGALRSRRSKPSTSWRKRRQMLGDLLHFLLESHMARHFSVFIGHLKSSFAA